MFGNSVNDLAYFPLKFLFQRTESWHCLPQEMDSSCTLDTAQTGFNMREKGTEVTDFTSLEEGISTQSENQGKDPNRDLLCSPLLGNTSLFLASSNTSHLQNTYGGLQILHLNPCVELCRTVLKHISLFLVFRTGQLVKFC